MADFDEYENYDALGLAELVRTGQVRPAELVECAVARIEAWNPALNAVVHKMYDRALAVANAPAGPSGPFAGVPFLLKDLLAAYAGEPLTASCRLLAEFVPDHDSELVARYKRAGVIVIGKTNTPEFGILPVTEPRLRGAARNPWNLDHTPGGSSGGAAAAVAAGIVPMAHGNDGGGSIRIPASCCGVFGLKPTRGRNPLGPDIGDAAGGLVQEHVLTRSVRDSAAMLDATHGADEGAPYHAPAPERPFRDEVSTAPGRLRIAFTKASLFGGTTHPDCAATVERAAELCRSLGHEVEETAPRLDKEVLARSYLLILACEAAQAVTAASRMAGRRPGAGDLEPQTRLLNLSGRRASGAELSEALETARMTGRHVARFLRRYDVFMTATMAHPPPRIGHFALTPWQEAGIALLRAFPVRKLLDRTLESLSHEAFETTGNTMLCNMTGQPAVSVPFDWNAAGLPIGVQFAARFGDEAVLFRLAAQLEQARPWAHRRPTPVTSLRQKPTPGAMAGAPGVP